MTNHEIVIECLKERIKNSNPKLQFKLTTMEMHAFNLLMKQDIYYKCDDSNDFIKQEMDKLWDEVITLNFNVWCNSINDNINISISDYFKSFDHILDNLLTIKLYINDTTFNLNRIYTLKEDIKKYIA